MADGGNDWIFDAVMNIFQSPTWEIPFNQFIDENCIFFDNADENSLAWTEIHQVLFYYLWCIEIYFYG